MLSNAGENLAKQILKVNNTIKKIKAREAELTKDLETTKKQLEFKSMEATDSLQKIQALKEKGKQLSETIRTNITQIGNLKTTISRLEHEVSESQASVFKLKANLKDAEKELSEAKQARLAEKDAFNSEALQNETEANKQLRKDVKEIKQSSRDTEAKLSKEVADF